MFAMVFGIIWLGSEIPYRRADRGFIEEDYEKAARLLDETDSKQKVIFGDDVLITRGRGFMVRYSDILWVHMVDSYYNGVYMGRSVRVHTRSRNEFKIAPSTKDSQTELADIMNAIVEKNPDVIVGYSRENKKLYDSLTKKRSAGSSEQAAAVPSDGEENK